MKKNYIYKIVALVLAFICIVSSSSAVSVLSFALEGSTSEETTTENQETTTVPEESTTVPEESTTVPEESTTAPETTTAAPETTTAASETTTAAPETTTAAPETTTVAPETTTAAPETTTAAPETTTAAPETTTAAPETTTVAPETTTAAPETTTSAPEETTTEAPVIKGYIMGDLNRNGVVSSDEARKVLRYSVSLDELSDVEMAYAEMNGDGIINSADARLVLRGSVKLEKEVRHEFTDIKLKKATCEVAGSISYKCTLCQKSFSYSVKARGHRYVETGRVSATCVADGKLSEKCSVCSKLNEKIYKATGHNWLAPTATTAKTCKTCKTVISGFNQVGDKVYYYNADGSVTSGERVLNAAYNGVTADWYLKNGELLYNFRGAVTVSGVDYIITEGKCRKVVTESDKTLFRAFKEVAKCTTPDMTKEEKLRACFEYCKTAYKERRPRTPHYQGMDWPVVYANDMFVGTGGNCFSYAAAFAYMAKAIGYEKVYACNSGGHGWAEIDGLIYDPEWSKHFHYYSYYALSYDTKTDVNYKRALTKTAPWMYIKI